MEAWFGRLAARVTDALVQLGFPPCSAGYMASNPRWCRSASAWRRQFDVWMQTPQPEAVLHASTFLDLRGVAGDPTPAAALREWLAARMPDCVLFLRHLARDAVTRRPPLGLFGGFVVERSGVHKDQLDLKSRGGRVGGGDLAEISGIGGVRETDAWEIMSRLRLRHQLACLDAGREADNHIDPGALSKAERLLLKEAFRTVEWLQSSVEDRFQTATVM